MSATAVRTAAVGATTVLLVEDNPADARLIRELLREGAPDAEVTWVTTAAEAREAVNRGVGAVLLDLGLPDAHGLDALRAVREANDAVPVVVLSGDDDEDLAIAAVAEGAQDYLVKGRVDGDLLARALRYAGTRHRAEMLLAAQTNVLQLIAAGALLTESLEAVARLVDDRCDGVACAIMVADEDESTLHVGAAPAFTDALGHALDGVPLAEHAPTPGVAAARGRPVTTLDVASDPGWAGFAAPLTAAGLPACWATPVATRRGSTVLGAVALHLPQAREPTPAEVELAGVATWLASVAIERDRFEKRLEYQAVHDPLTALPNRVLFLDRLGQALARSSRDQSRVAVMFCDLDRFKLVNDSRGHRAGDQLLVQVGHRLARAVRPGDTVARFGGDEFAVLCEDLDNDGDATVVAQRLLDLLAEPIPLAGTDVRLSASIGIAFGGRRGPDADTLLQQADAAMYQAKQQGRARWSVFDAPAGARAVARLDTELALRRALDDHHLTVHFQPEVSLDGERVIGAEALVRWDDPERGLLLPGDFIPVAEDSNLIVDIGSLVLRDACRAAAGWATSNGHAAPVVSVNVSPRQLVHPQLPAAVAQALAEADLPAHRLCLEVTETMLLGEADVAREVLGDLHALGLTIAIDDFGTGYSSLAHLRRMPLDGIKIDLSFVQGLGEDREDEKIVAAVVHLAADLGLTAIAEGVETPQQRDHLRRLGCPVAQGYLFGRPMPAGVFAAWLRHRV